MSACAVHPLEPADPFQEFRAMARQSLDRWLDQLRPLFEQETPPTLREMSQRFMETRTSLLGEILQSLGETLYAAFLEQKQCPCPKCNTLLNRKRMDSKKYNTLQGEGTLERPYFYCKPCQHGFHPLDEAREHHGGWGVVKPGGSR